MFPTKLTREQKDEIFREYLRATTSEQMHFASVKAEELGVSHSTIQRIIHDPKRQAAYLTKVNEIRDMQMARMWEHAGDAVDVHINIVKRADEFPDNLKSFPQNSANALLDRIGLKAEKDDGAETKVTFDVSGGMDIGMPKAKKGED